MVKEENWGVSPERIRRFFEKQPDVQADSAGFSYGACRIHLEPVTAMVMGKWPMERTRVRFEGPDEDLQIIHRRFFLEFLSAGG